MKKKLLIVATTAILVFLLSSCGGCDTAECYESKAKYEAQRAETARLDAEARQERAIAEMKAKAEIEASKPESVRLQEAKNEETTLGDGIETAAIVAGGAYTVVKLFDIMTR